MPPLAFLIRVAAVFAISWALIALVFSLGDPLAFPKAMNAKGYGVSKALEDL